MTLIIAQVTFVAQLEMTWQVFPFRFFFWLWLRVKVATAFQRFFHTPFALSLPFFLLMNPHSSNPRGGSMWQSIRVTRSSARHLQQSTALFQSHCESFALGENLKRNFYTFKSAFSYVNTPRKNAKETRYIWNLFWLHLRWKTFR